LASPPPPLLLLLLLLELATTTTGTSPSLGKTEARALDPASIPMDKGCCGLLIDPPGLRTFRFDLTLVPAATRLPAELPPDGAPEHCRREPPSRAAVESRSRESQSRTATGERIRTADEQSGRAVGSCAEEEEEEEVEEEDRASLFSHPAPRPSSATHSLSLSIPPFHSTLTLD
jgi:hypothetical protein